MTEDHASLRERLHRPRASHRSGFDALVALVAFAFVAGPLLGPGLARTLAPSAALSAAPWMGAPLRGLLPTAGRTGSGDQGAGTADPAGPSIMALDAAAHANDAVRFTPGGRVTIPFSPRADDHWAVGGVAPQSLPAGAASGRSMATSRQGSVWASGSLAGPLGPLGSIGSIGALGSIHPIDGSSLLAGSAFGATAASYPLRAIDPLAPAAGSDLRRQVFGFLPYWTLGDSSTVLKYDLLSTIAYFGVGVDSSGNLQKQNADGSTTAGWAGWTSSDLTATIEAAHQRGTRVVLTVQSFAWTSTQAANQAALLGSGTAQANLAQQIAAAVRDRGADGVNLDFEPLTAGHEADFTAFVRLLRSQLDAIAPGYQLTFDTTGYIGNYPIEDATAPGAADAIFIMGYDYRTAPASSAGSVAPLTGPNHDLTDTAFAYVSRVPAAKLIMGIPYYGRAWSTVSDAPNAKTQNGTKYGQSVSVNYTDAVDLAAKYGRRWDAVEQSAWFAYQRQNCSTTYGCVTTWREVYYDDAQSLGAKYDMVNRFGLRGAGMWALGYDGARPELYQALVDKFIHDTTPPEAGIQVLPPTQGDEGFPVSWSATDLSPIANYDVQVAADGGPWTAWLSGTTATTGIYLGSTAHAYAFRVRATDSKGNVGTWDVANQAATTTPSLGVGGFALVAADTLSVRTRPTTSGALVDRLAAGDVVAITDGPVSANGYSWYQVTGPLSSWSPTNPVLAGNWVAAGSGSVPYLTARQAPNATVVAAGISGLSLGAGIGTTAIRAFSPNGDGSADTLAVQWQNNVPLDSLTLHVFGADGTEVGTEPMPAAAPGPQTWAWDGRAGGAVLPDGQYLLQVVGQGGGRTYSAPFAGPMPPDRLPAFGVTIDTVAPTLTSATISGLVISPNGDGRFDTIALAATSAGGGTHWQFSAAPIVADVVGAPVRTIVGTGGAPKLSWDGRGDAAAILPAAAYRLSLAVLDDAGNAVAKTWDVTLDATAPTSAASATPPVFSPDGDGSADTTTIDWTAGESLPATVLITHGKTQVRSFRTAAALAGHLRWDGRNASGQFVADGSYLVRVILTDAAGNQGAASLAVKVDRTAGWLRWSSAAFYPQDGDALARTAALTFRLTRSATTTLQLVDAAGAVVRTAWTNRSLAAGAFSWTWDGKAAGTFVVPGTYTAVLTSTSPLGTTTLRRAILVDAFIVRLSATTLAVGQTLTVAFQSVEPLSTRPVVTFSQPGVKPITRTATLLSTNRYTVSFTVDAGTPGIASIRVLARDARGGINGSLRSVTIQ